VVRPDGPCAAVPRAPTWLCCKRSLCRRTGAPGPLPLRPLPLSPLPLSPLPLGPLRLSQAGRRAWPHSVHSFSAASSFCSVDAVILNTSLDFAVCSNNAAHGAQSSTGACRRFTPRSVQTANKHTLATCSTSPVQPVRHSAALRLASCRTGERSPRRILGQRTDRPPGSFPL
jgi:hypothetical protein